MGKSHSARRAQWGALPLYPFDASRGWKPIRHSVLYEVGAAKMASGEWGLMRDDNNRPWYYRIAVRSGIPVDESDPASITASDVQMIAGLCGLSRTMGKKQRDSGSIPRPMDAIEHAIEKLKQWPFPASRIDDGSGQPVYGDRAVRWYPKPG